MKFSEKANEGVKFLAVIFDLDGTLADTLEDLANATNWALEQLGLPTHGIEEYRYLVGSGRTELCRRAIPAERQDLLDQTIQLMTQYYADHCFDTTRLYPGIADAVKSLSARGLKIAVLSNKPHDFVGVTINRLFGDFKFDILQGDADHLPRKPDPTGALQIARKLQVDPNRIAYVGDTCIDMETANRAGMYAIGVLWGFRDRKELEESGARIVVQTAQELYQAIAE